jgi:two-component system sensor histidine kinase/response regulator
MNPGGKRDTIVNVDDSEAARYARTRILTRAGFEVYEAGTAKEAFELIEAHHPDLVTLDVHLPDLNGKDVCRKLKAKPESASIIVLQISASATTGPHAISALNNGADAYLTEPTDPDVLVATIRALLRLRKAERDLAAANEVLGQLNRDLRRSNEDLQQFAFMASHDLQEPLRMINTFTQLLVKRFGQLDDPAVAQYAGFINEGVQRMETLIHNVLSYSRSVHSNRDSLKATDLADCWRQALWLLDGAIKDSGATIVCERLPTVSADEEQMTQVFQNLLSNALKYRKASEPPCISVSVHRHESDWIISVRDNGIGFEQQYADRIFGLFKRLHRGDYPGTGLGLAICKRVIERYGGRIWAESELGSGSTFYFAMPSE